MKILALVLCSIALAHAQKKGEEPSGHLSFPPDAKYDGEPMEGINEKGDVVGDDGFTRTDGTGGREYPELVLNGFGSKPEPHSKRVGLMHNKRKQAHSRDVDLDQVSGLCFNSANLALQATPSGSGGGSGGLGPQNMNDDQANSCGFYWPFSYFGGTIQYVWQTAVSIDHFVIASDAFCAGVVPPPPAGSCALESGRSVGSGDVEFWDSTTSQWIHYGSFSGVMSNQVVFQFAQCVTTTALRVTNLRTPTCNTQINPKIYEWSVCECNTQVAPLDDLCTTLANVAPNAVATSSGGGVGVFGPQNMNDQSPYCIFHWPRSNEAFGGAGATIEYSWATAQPITKFVIGTDAFCGIQAGCQQALGRGVSQGAVEYLSSGQWVQAGTFTNSTGERIEFNFPQCVSTTGLRVTNVRTHSCNGGFVGHPVVYEWAVCKCPYTPL